MQCLNVQPGEFKTEEEVMSVLGLDKEFKAVYVKKKKKKIRQSYEIFAALST